ncbi:glutamine amidotransferase, partial [Weissella cibaria]|nr:glutamine amidotransferase [Weissella cibaria]
NGELAKQMLLEALSIKYPDADLTPQEGLIVQPTF